jgi:hypothetical protein
MTDAAKVPATTSPSDGSFLGPFLASRGGTFIRLGMSAALIGLGVLAATSPASWALVGSAIVMLCIALGIAGMAYSLADYPLQSCFALLVLPPCLWVWYMGMPFVTETMPAAGWISVVVGIIPLAMRGTPAKA